MTNAASAIAFTNAAACSPLTLTYLPNLGALQSATQVFAHVGYAGWTTVFPTQRMTRVGTNAQWSLTVTPPQDVGQLNVAFQNGAGTWDLNGGTNWNLALNTCTSAAVLPSLAITNPAGPTQVVAAGTASILLQGTSTGTVGWLTWSNRLTSTDGVGAGATSWTLAAIALGAGTNALAISGTNAPTRVVASDSGGNFLYADGWTTNDNGGYGFGPWRFAATSTNAALNGRFVASNSAVSIGVPAWGLYANATNLSEVRRTLTNGLSAGQTLSVRIDNGLVDSGGGVGVALQNAGGDNLLQLYFNGGDAAYTFAGTATDIGWTTNGLDLAVSLVGPTSYVARLTPLDGAARTYAGSFSPATNMAPSVFRAWNWNAGAGSNHDFYVSALQVSTAGVATVATASVTVVRPPDLVYHALTVLSSHGAPMPAGVSSNLSGTIVTAIVDAVETLTGAVQYACAGWSLGGATDTNGAAAGPAARVVLVLTNATTIEWRWTTNYWLGTATNGAGTISFTAGGAGWNDATGSAVLVAVADANWSLAGWGGDTVDCSVVGAQLGAPMTQARSLVAIFTSNAPAPAVQIEWTAAAGLRIASSNLVAGTTVLLMRADSLLDGAWLTDAPVVVTGPMSNWVVSAPASNAYYRLERR